MPRSARIAVRAPATGGLVTIATWTMTVLAVLALAYVTYLLWPRWPEAPSGADAPTLPIVVGDVAFNVPPQAIRQKVQRRPGAQERIDLAYAWPSLQPAAVVFGDRSAMSLPPARLFVTISSVPTALTPEERLKTIYPRYTEASVMRGPDGLSLLPFRDGTPYEGEDLLFDPDSAERFLVRCTRNKGQMPGTCIYERFFGSTDVNVRVPRDWLTDWRGVLAGIERLIERLAPASR